MQLTYVVPLRRTRVDARDDELAAYLLALAPHCQVIVVDGSTPVLFEEAAARWGGAVTHVPVARSGSTTRPARPANGKALGVCTGIGLARHERIVVADDDVRYDLVTLARVAAALDRADVVVPQNVFVPMPWHAVWDTSRSLVNRALGGDAPGTMAMRRTRVRDGYRADVLFENLELVRTVRARGGRPARRDDLIVARRPPTTDRFVEQRIRQAYDEWARPWRLAVALAIVPSVVRWRHRPPRLLAAGLGCIAVAEAGRRRAGGRRHLPLRSTLVAPAWALERGVTAWIAVARRLAGGCPYAGGRLVVAATPAWRLAAIERARAAPADGAAQVAAGSTSMKNRPLLCRVQALSKRPTRPNR